MSHGSRDHRRDRAFGPVPVVASLVALVVIACVSPAFAQSARTDRARVGGGTDLWIETRALLEPVTSYDFGEAFGGRPSPALEGIDVAAATKGRITTSFNAPPTASTITIIRREIDSLWRLNTRGGNIPAATSVNYDVIGKNGERGVLSHHTNDRSVIAVRVVEQPIRIIERPSGSSTIEGGVLLEMDLGQALEAGHYGGSLTITVVQL